MTVEKEFQGFLVCCDHCSDYVDVHSPGHHWSDVQEAIQSEGYTADKVRGEWQHTCPSCQEKETSKDGGGLPDGETW